MRSLVLTLACVGVLFSHCNALPAENMADEDDEGGLYTLPEGFLLGAGTSAFQVEGAWDQDGKGESILDNFYHVLTDEITNADTSADHYNRFKEDIALLAKMKMNIFRFSISWGRIFPNGRHYTLEPRGVQHYHDVIDELLKYNIQPLITMVHADIPMALQREFGGWYSAEMVDVFTEYADFLFNEYGDKVKYWNTLNEPNGNCKFMPALPNIRMSGDYFYFNCLHNQILAHSKAYRIYQDKYAKKQKGLVGIGSVSFFGRPNSTEYDDIAATKRANTLDLGMILHPLVYGDYPPLARRVLDDKANATHYSVLPKFTEEQKKLVIGATDFIGVNSYASFNISDKAKKTVEIKDDQSKPPSLSIDDPLETIEEYIDDIFGMRDIINVTVGLNDSTAEWILGDIAMWINDNYGKDIKIFFTENGIPYVETIHDYHIRAAYVSRVLRYLLRVTHRYNLNVMGYSYWSLLDSFEFVDAYVGDYGIIKVDFKHDSLKRTLRDSWTFFEEVMTTRRVPLINGSDKKVASFTLLICILVGSTFNRLFT